MQPLATSDPVQHALARKARAGAAGTAKGTVVATGAGWRVVDIVCTSGPHDRVFDEVQGSASISLVLSGMFVYRSQYGSSLLSPGSLLLGNTGQAFACSHEHGEGDRCLSFQFDDALFERVASDAGATRVGFDRHRLPPVRPLAPLVARAAFAVGRGDAFEEIALELAGAVIQATADPGRVPARANARDHARVTHVLRALEGALADPHPLGELARLAGFSPYHFLRSFKEVTGVTPHQWLLRARLRAAAGRLVGGDDAITDIALDVGFDDLSNFIRTFRAEFGVSPRRYRGLAAGRSGPARAG